MITKRKYEKSRAGGRLYRQLEATLVDGLLRQLVHEVFEVFVEVAAEVGLAFGVDLAESVEGHCFGPDVLLLLLLLPLLLVLLPGLDELAPERVVLDDEVVRVGLVGEVVALGEAEELALHVLAHVDGGQLLVLVVPEPAVVLDYLGLVEARDALSPPLPGQPGLAADDCDVGEGEGLFACFILINHRTATRSKAYHCPKSK